jgi:hypothetical protein
MKTSRVPFSFPFVITSKRPLRGFVPFATLAGRRDRGSQASDRGVAGRAGRETCAKTYGPVRVGFPRHRWAPMTRSAGEPRLRPPRV